MKLDARSEMALNLIINTDQSRPDAFRMLAYICKQWGMTSDESFPLVQELVARMGIDVHSAIPLIKTAVREANADKSISEQAN